MDAVRLHKIYERLMLKDVSDMHRIVEVEENEVDTNTIQCLQLKGLLTNSIIQHVIFQVIIS